MFNPFLALFPEIFLICATLILLIHGVVFSTSDKSDYPPLASNVAWLGLPSVLITILMLAAGGLLLTTAHLLCNHFLRKDDFTYYLQIFLLLSTAGTILMSFGYFKQEGFNAFEFIVLILLSTRSMLFMISAYDLISMYLAIELQIFRFHVIAARKGTLSFPRKPA